MLIEKKNYLCFLYAVAEQERVDLSGHDVYAVAGTLKKYLRELPNPVIPVEMYSTFIESASKFWKIVIVFNEWSCWFEKVESFVFSDFCFMKFMCHNFFVVSNGDVAFCKHDFIFNSLYNCFHLATLKSSNASANNF